MDSDDATLKGRARRWILRRMTLMVFAALSPMCRQRSMMSSTNESKWLYRGSNSRTSHGRAGENGISGSRRTGDGIIFVA